MANDNFPNEKGLEINELTGIQYKTTRFLKKPGEAWESENTDFSTVIGGVSKAKGYDQRGSTITERTTTSTSTSTTMTTTSTSTTTS